MKSRAVFIDRDGVLNRVRLVNGKPFPPRCLKELEILPDVQEALLNLKALDYLLVCVTNQPDVARGEQQQTVVENIHRVLLKALPLSSIRVCYHDDSDCCGCRKPLPGLLIDAANDYNVNLSASFMVGDRWRDIEAGRQARCTTILIEAGYTDEVYCRPNYNVSSLKDAATLISLLT